MLQDALDAAIEGATGGIGLGLVVVAAGGLLLARGGKPAAKTAIKGWFAGRDKLRDVTSSARSAFAEAGERMQDLYAEARAEARGEGAAEATA